MIKIEVKKGLASQKFPLLMISKESGNIVLFTKTNWGTILLATKQETDHQLGYHSTCWNMDYFEPFMGEITLTND